MLSRSSIVLRRLAVPRIVQPVTYRAFSRGIALRDEAKPKPATEVKMKTYQEITCEEDLIGPGAKPGEVPTDLEQATGLERLEILGKMAGVDIFHQEPLDTSRLGTLDNPIPVKSVGPEQYVGCTGVPSGSHPVKWITLFKHRPIGRCQECGNCIKMEYIGPEDDPHDHDYPGKYTPPKTMADFVKPEYW